MNEMILELKAALETCFTGQLYFTAFWHDAEAEMPAVSDARDMENLRNIVLREHLYNFQLWHVEDTARRRDVTDAVIADCKRKVDELNQKRNDCIEEMDRCLLGILTPVLPPNATARQNTETVGMAVDRISILALKLYHMEEQTKRTDVKRDHIRSCAEKLRILRRQRTDLVRAVLELISDYGLGNRTPAVYAQFKMYNDPNLNPELYGRAKV
jgi:hypothetical protein